jgi:hypothetical protein
MAPGGEGEAGRAATEVEATMLLHENHVYRAPNGRLYAAVAGGRSSSKWLLRNYPSGATELLQALLLPTDLEASRVTFLTVSHDDTIDRVTVVCGSKSVEMAVLLGLSDSSSLLETKREPTGWTADDLKDTGIVVAPEGETDGADDGN